MSDFQISKVGDQIVVRASISVDETVEIRDSLIDEFRRIPKLNQELFSDFAEWVFEEIHDTALTTLAEMNNPDSNCTDLPEEPSTFEPW
jgi:hypothetical protein